MIAFLSEKCHSGQRIGNSAFFVFRAPFAHHDDHLREDGGFLLVGYSKTGLQKARCDLYSCIADIHVKVGKFCEVLRN